MYPTLWGSASIFCAIISAIMALINIIAMGNYISEKERNGKAALAAVSGVIFVIMIILWGFNAHIFLSAK